jgi:hypothetical protein
LDESFYRIEPLDERHNRAAFSCGVEALDRYLQKQAGQDVSKHVAAAFIITPDGETIAGFYTLSAHVVSLSELLKVFRRSFRDIRKFPRRCWGDWR